jgi:hypothetical protein
MKGCCIGESRLVCYGCGNVQALIFNEVQPPVPNYRSIRIEFSTNTFAVKDAWDGRTFLVAYFDGI